MKIIELLNKIAKGEEVPKKIKYGATVFILDYFSTENKEAQYISENYKKVLLEGLSTTMCLNDSVEIIEEKEIEFEDIKELGNNFTFENTNSELEVRDFEKSIISKKINSLIKNQKKIIDVINDMRDKE